MHTAVIYIGNKLSNQGEDESSSEQQYKHSSETIYMHVLNLLYRHHRLAELLQRQVPVRVNLESGSKGSVP